MISRCRQRLGVACLLGLISSSSGCVLFAPAVATGATAGSAVPPVAAALDHVAPSDIPPGAAVRIEFGEARPLRATSGRGDTLRLGRVTALVGRATRSAGDSLWMSATQVTGAHGRTRPVDARDVLVLAGAGVRMQVLARASVVRERNAIVGATAGAIVAAAALALLLEGMQ